MRKYMFILILLALHANTAAFGKEKLIKSRKYSLWFGTRILQIDSLPNAAHIDFMNYIHATNGFMEYFYLGFAGHFWMRNHWEADFKFFSADDIYPNSFNISVQHLPVKNFGFNIGIYGYSLDFGQFFTYHLLQDQGYYQDSLSMVSFGQTMFDIGIMTGPVFSIDHKRFIFNLKLNAGVGTFVPFEMDFWQKKRNSNLRRQVVYEGKLTPTFFFLPELEMGLNLFKISNTTFGIQVQANAYISNRAINHTQSIHNWVRGTPDIQEVRNPRHKFHKYDVDAGIFWRF